MTQRGWGIAVFYYLFSATLSLAAQPDSNFTPGALCSPDDPNFKGYSYPSHVARCDRNVGQQEKSDVADHYGVPKSDWSQYEFDHLIPLCAGGSNDIKNLWPQPLDEAKKKDKLEDDVCMSMQAGTMTQDEAVQKIHAWFAAQEE